jgi:hypothetical protein
MLERVGITVSTDDPIYQIWCWRNDSARLFVLQPVLDLAMEMPEQPCVLGERYACRPQSCSPCLIHELQHRMRRSIT